MKNNTTNQFADSVINTTLLKSNKTFNKYMAMIANGHFEESDIIAMRSFMKKNSEAASQIIAAMQGKEFTLSTKQQAKGIECLRDQWKTARGVERKNNPFSSFETDILENYSHFTFVGLVNINSEAWPFYLPVYRCYAKDGSYFDYYYQGRVIIK